MLRSLSGSNSIYGGKSCKLTFGSRSCIRTEREEERLPACSSERERGESEAGRRTVEPDERGENVGEREMDQGGGV